MDEGLETVALPLHRDEPPSDAKAGNIKIFQSGSIHEKIKGLAYLSALQSWKH